MSEDEIEVGLEASEADAVEQHAATREAEQRWPLTLPSEANEADAVEQGAEVGLDDDDYQR